MDNHSFYKIIGEIGSPDRLLTATISILVVVFVGIMTGPLGGNANPFLWNLLDAIFGPITRKTYNISRTPSSLAFRGWIFTLITIITAIALGCAAHLFIRYYPLHGFVEPLFLSLTLSGGATWVSLNKLYRALSERETLTKGSYRPIAVSTRSNLNTTDDYGIVRAGIGFMAQNFDKAFVAPLFWYLIGGIPLAFLYAGIAASRWGLAKDGFAKGIGDAAMWFDKIFGFIPHIFTSMFMIAACLFTPGTRITRAIPGLFSPHGHAHYHEGGLPLTIVAWGMNLSLGGPVQDLDGSVIRRNWIGPLQASARIKKIHLRRAIYMSVMAYILVLAALVSAIAGQKLLFMLL